VSEYSIAQTITTTNSCPLWFVFRNKSTGRECSPCVCKKDFEDVIICDENLQESYLLLGYCMTYNSSHYEQGSDAISFGGCPYVYYSNVANHRYIALPHNILHLNDVFCVPLNRDGLLCRDCIEGFGPSVVTTGYACANSTGNNYGWVLYILSEFVPATVFYFAVLTLRIRITSAPMSCFVMISQILVTLINEDSRMHGVLMEKLDTTTLAVFKVILTGYGFWNLDYFRYLIPPFCVSQGLKNMHVLALQYVSAFYPLLLIALTYACIELHGHNFRPIVWLWKPFHRCCVNVRRRWDIRASIIDVFATFLLLAYCKLMFVSLYLLGGANIYHADGEHVSSTSYVLLVDATVHYFSKEHLPFAITAILILFFLFLPPFLLIFYHCKIFNRCLNCCHKRRCHALHTFVEAFHGCYKNGLSGGWDFRSMSGLYMLFRVLVVLVDYHVVNQVGWLLRTLVCLSLSTFILIVQPYRRRYMNVMDGLLLVAMGFLTLLIVTFLYILPSSNETLHLIFVIACGFPQFVLLLSVTYSLLKGKHIAKYIAGKVCDLMKQICTQQQNEDELSDDDPLPDRLINPNQYSRSLLSQPEQAHVNSETLTVRGQRTPVNTYGSIS